MKRPSLYWLLALVPASLVLRALGHDLAVFITSVLAIIPLAGLIGRGTDQLALHAGPHDLEHAVARRVNEDATRLAERHRDG